jgi:hypothetical protein
MPLMRYNGILLRRSDGVLACSSEDCCEVDPPPCADCCVQITSGALIDGVIKIFAFDGDRTLEISITTPTGTRTVCEDDEIEIVIEYLIDGEFPPTPIYASVVVDPAWELIAVTPSPDGDDFVFSDGPGGWIYWVNEELGVAQPTLGVTLKFNSCYFNFLSDLGAIVIYVEGIEEVISIERCNVDAVCCTLIAECEPCCLLLDPFGDVVNYNRWVWNEELQRFEWLHKIVSSDGLWVYWALLWIRPEPPTDPLEVEKIAQWCYDETWTFGVDITAGNFETSNESDAEATLFVEACEFGYVPEPTPADFAVSYAPLTIEWEPDEIGTQKQYEWALLRSCEFPGCDTITVTLDITSPTNTFVNTGEPWVISFFECPPLEGEECCCTCCEATTFEVRYLIKDTAAGRASIMEGTHEWALPLDLLCGAQVEIPGADHFRTEVVDGDVYEHRMEAIWIRCPDSVALLDVVVRWTQSLHKNGTLIYSDTFPLFGKTCPEIPTLFEFFENVGWAEYEVQLR